MSITLMIVDEAEIVRNLIHGALRGSVATDFLEAKNATEALKTSREYRGPIHLLLSAVVMAGRMTGIEMVTKLCRTRPETKVLLMSGYVPEVVGHFQSDPLPFLTRLTIKPEWNFVRKPFAASEIRETIRNILAEKFLVVAY